MTHYVLIQPPHGDSVHVRCDDVDECLKVVEGELKTGRQGTHVVIYRERARQTAKVLATWEITAKGPRRYRV